MLFLSLAAPPSAINIAQVSPSPRKFMLMCLPAYRGRALMHASWTCLAISLLFH